MTNKPLSPIERLVVQANSDPGLLSAISLELGAEPDDVLGVGQMERISLGGLMRVGESAGYKPSIGLHKQQAEAPIRKYTYTDAEIEAAELLFTDLFTSRVVGVEHFRASATMGGFHVSSFTRAFKSIHPNIRHQEHYFMPKLNEIFERPSEDIPEAFRNKGDTTRYGSNNLLGAQYPMQDLLDHFDTKIEGRLDGRRSAGTARALGIVVGNVRKHAS